uniref:EF-hand domain-containing protein n=1 Tax=Monopterus albus TaxID=43700 RepID=A0A3Q3JM83_MONAL
MCNKFAHSVCIDSDTCLHLFDLHLSFCFRLKVSIDDNCKRLSYIDFLSAFDQSEEKCEPPPASPDAMRQIESLECLSPGMALLRSPSTDLLFILPQSSLQCTSRHPASAGRPETGSPLGSMERRVRGAVQRCWKEILKNCAEKDPQQKGHISTASFLGEHKTRLSCTDQLKHLAVKFDFMNNDCVLSQDCVEVMLRAYDVVRSSCTSIRRRFLMSDHARTGSVSVQDFRKVLCHFGVNLSEEEFFHLSSYFDAHTTGKICYNNFLWVFLH